MKISLMITENTLQVNLTADSDHERMLLRTLSNYEGPARIKKGEDINRCRGNYLRNFGHESESSTAIVIDREEDKGNE